MNKQEYLEYCNLRKMYEQKSEEMFNVIKNKFTEILSKTDAYLKENLTEYEYKNPGIIDNSYFYFTKRKDYFLSFNDDGDCLKIMVEGYDYSDETVATFPITVEMFDDDFVEVFMQNWLGKEEVKKIKRIEKKELQRLEKIKKLQEELSIHQKK